MEVGHAIENACLQAISLGLGSVVIGAFNDNDVQSVMKLEPGEQPLLMLLVGRH
jgi:nitroreductase